MSACNGDPSFVRYIKRHSLYFEQEANAAAEEHLECSPNILVVEQCVQLYFEHVAESTELTRADRQTQQLSLNKITAVTGCINDVMAYMARYPL